LATSGSPNEVTTVADVVASARWHEPEIVDWTTEYLKKLLTERHYIRAALENPGGSIIVQSTRAAEADQLSSYQSFIGNGAHLDLLSAEQQVNRLELHERIELLAWCDGLNPREAATFANIHGGKIRATSPAAIRKRRERATTNVVEALND
jgi:hypothetical protein